MNRRGFLGAILAAGMAPAVVRAASLMPVRVTDAIAVPAWVNEPIVIVHPSMMYELLGQQARDTMEQIAYDVLRRGEVSAW